MLTLYRFPGATCAAKVLMALYEKEIPFEDKVVGREELTSEWYRKLNPNRVVPTITHNGNVIIESSVILNYIDDAFQGLPLRPGDALGRARMNHWLKLLDDALSSLGTLTYAMLGRHVYLAKTAAEREAYYASIPDMQLRQSRRNAIELGLDAPDALHALSVLRGLPVRADATMGDGQYLLGEFSLADISLVPFIARLDVLGLLPAGHELPNFQRWWKAICQRPSFEKAVVAPMPAIEQQRAAAAALAGRMQVLLGQLAAA